LFQTSRVAGGDWLDRVLGAYQTFSAATVEDEDAGIMLLRDIQSVLNKRGCSRIYSAELVDALIGLEESPWSEWKRGKPMTQTSLARLLKPFKITPKGIRAGDKVRRGYDVQQFGNAFSRYLPRPAHPAPTATPLQPLVHKALGHSQSATAADRVALLITPKPICDGACSTVADQLARSADGGTPVGEDVEFF